MTMTELVQEAAAFVAEAERMTNERDVDGIRTVFAPDGHWTAILDGTVMEAQGVEEIRRNWALLCDVMERRHMYVTKSLVIADEHTIVNEWTGTVRGRDAARGIEVWVRDDDGLVVDQRLYTFSDVRSESNPVQNLRMLVAHPMTAAAFVRAKVGGSS